VRAWVEAEDFGVAKRLKPEINAEAPSARPGRLKASFTTAMNLACADPFRVAGCFIPSLSA